MTFESATTAASVRDRLVDALTEAGHRCSAFETMGDAALFRTKVERRDFSLLVGPVPGEEDRWLLSMGRGGMPLQRVLGGKAKVEHRVLARRIHRALTEDPLISDIRWYTSDAWAAGPDAKWTEEPQLD